MKLNLNCDLGEGESIRRTRALMRWITSANIAAGGHAGDAQSMTVCARLAREFKVHAGAHPGLPSRDDFGRGAVELTPRELKLLLLHQVGGLERVARHEGVRVHHIKLHGALYHATETNAALRRGFLEAIRTWWPKLEIYALAGGRVACQARRWGLKVREEGFIDRGYRDDGSLVPRSELGALLPEPAQARLRLEEWMRNGTIITVTGRRLRLRVDTWCVHSDTAGSLAVLQDLGFPTEKSE